MDAEILVKFRMKRVCDEDELDNSTFKEVVEGLIEEDGLFDLVEDKFEVVEVRRI